MSAPKFWWFQGDSVEKLLDQLMGAADTARLEVRIDKQDRMTFRVVADKVHDPIDNSHVCPPQCP